MLLCLTLPIIIQRMERSSSDKAILMEIAYNLFSFNDTFILKRILKGGRKMNREHHVIPNAPRRLGYSTNTSFQKVSF